MTADSLAPAFRATILLVLLLLMIRREDLKRITAIDPNWYWFAVSLNGLVLFLHFSHPAKSVLGLALFMFSACYFVWSKPGHLSDLLPNLLGLCLLTFCLRLFFTRDGSIVTVIRLSPEFLCIAVMTVGLSISFRHAERLVALNAFMVLEKVVLATVLPLFGPERGIALSDSTLFNEYWILTLLLTAQNAAGLFFVRTGREEPRKV